MKKTMSLDPQYLLLRMPITILLGVYVKYLLGTHAQISSLLEGLKLSKQIFGQYFGISYT